MKKKAIIIGAGPAGLTAAYEFLTRTDIIPIILEKSGEIGGISRTTNYKGNRMDMGPHRFFSKSDRVMDWWLKMMPLEDDTSGETTIKYQNKTRNIAPQAGRVDGRAKSQDKVMLVIRRLTRIYFLRKFFAYPIQLSLDTLRTLGLIRTIKILLSFLWMRLFPRRPEKNLEDFIINKFGRQLYLLFFKDYTEKVWGIPPVGISAEWGAQRIKGISLGKAVASALKSMRRKKANDIRQKGAETSLIEQFLYPKYGPGSLWEEVASQVQEMGGKIYLHQDVQHVYTAEGRVRSVITSNSETGQTGAWEGDYFFSTMPVQELIGGMGNEVPHQVQEIAAGLQYRDFINVGILLRQLSDKSGNRLDLKDNWIYIQERDVKVGRLMIYNNWGGGMIKDPNTTWIGMEYFCNKADDFWAQPDHAIERFAIAELQKMDLARSQDILDSTVRRMEKTYPAYFGTYNEFDKVRAYTDSFENLFLVGRNGMHKYNNADHSMLTAMVAVDNIVKGVTAKTNIWAINTEQEYHEEKKGTREVGQASSEDISSLMPIAQPLGRRESFFPDYLWRNKWNRAFVIFAFIAFITQFILFKIKYPYANYMPDSYSYIDAAMRNLDVNTWPVAYSKFLRQISVFTHSDTIVVGIQYLFLQCSGVFFLFSLFYLFNPHKITRFILYSFFVFNPLSLYVANYISADALFTGLSILWVTQLIWIICKPRKYYVLTQAILLLAAFTVRYNAIYYPLIAAFAFILSRQSWRIKVAGVALGSFFILISVLFTRNKMAEVTGKRQFSAFGGWQLANNALYMYEHVPPDDRQAVPERFKRLELMVRAHLDTLNRVKLTTEDTLYAHFYLWNENAPLMQYMLREWKNDTVTPYFKKWASEGPLFTAYGSYLLQKYPKAFFRSFLLPNAIKYLIPPVEFIGVYNMGMDSVKKLAKSWFNYKTQKVQEHSSTGNAKISIVQYSPFGFMLINLFFLVCLTGLALITGFKQGDKLLFRLLSTIMFFWLLNAGFSIFASPIVLRYQLFPMIVCFSFGGLAADAIYKWGIQSDLNLKKQ